MLKMPSLRRAVNARGTMAGDSRHEGAQTLYTAQGKFMHELPAEVRKNLGGVHASRIADRYFTTCDICRIGMNNAITIPPTTVPIATISMGSMRLVMVSTMARTSAS
jgi:hypothetical protein